MSTVMKEPSAKEPKPESPRGRPRSFDRDAALERAMEVFWKQGYEGTSMSELTAAMEINPPSLYAAFGDKEQLFLEALERYEAKRRENVIDAFAEAPTARAAVERLLTEAATELSSAGHPRGCMLVMSAATCSAASQDMQAEVAKRRAGMKKVLKARIERAIAEGELPRSTDSAALTDFYSAVFQGMSMQARDGASRKSLLATAQAAMRAWPASAKRSSR
jgi:TetR/AcrR family transcriptional regulator, copper-responsive repressor